MKFIKIRLNQIWRQKNHKMSVIICGKCGGKWMAKTMTDKPGVYRDTHRLAERTLLKHYELLP